MTLKNMLNEQMKAAQKSKDKARLTIIRMIRSEVLNAEIEHQTELEDAQVIEILSRMNKQHQESILAFKQGNRPDLVQKEETELRIIEEFLPAQMSVEQINQMVAQAIEKLQASGLKDMGKVMAAIKGDYTGRASGKTVSAEVKKQLGQLQK